MKRWMAIAAALGIAVQAGTISANAREPQYVASPSDLPVHSASTRLAAPDEPWMRSLDDVVGPDDIVGSAVLPGPVTDLYDGPADGELPWVHPPNCECCIDDTPVSRFRQSCYQGTSLSGGYLGDGGSDARKIAHYELTSRWAIPIDGMDNALIIAPSFRQEFIDSPASIDIPDELFVTGVNFTWLKTISPRMKMTTMVTPSVRSDFETSDEAFRIFGLGMLTYNYIPSRLDASFGVVYLDRDDIPILPVLGFTWTPTSDWRIDANFPRPRIAHRTAKCGHTSESWVYTGVALGGNTYAVERASGASDVLTLTDYQWVFGWEHLRDGGRGLFVETGAAFGRSLEFDSTGEEIDFDDALFIRAGLTL